MAPPQAVRSTPAMKREARARGSIPAAQAQKTRERLLAPAGSLSFKLVEVAGIEPACPWPLRMASTLIVPFYIHRRPATARAMSSTNPRIEDTTPTPRVALGVMFAVVDLLASERH